MAKYKIGERIRIRRDANSQFRGRTGIVSEEPNTEVGVFGYIVKIEARGFTPSCLIMEKDLEAVTDE